MVTNYIRDYEKIDLRQFGDHLCEWGGLLEWIGYISVTVWRLYIWSTS
jgi:hypothetical protein